MGIIEEEESLEATVIEAVPGVVLNQDDGSSPPLVATAEPLSPLSAPVQRSLQGYDPSQSQRSQQQPQLQQSFQYQHEPQQYEQFEAPIDPSVQDESAMFRRRAFQSRHRQDLDHLETDAAHNCAHPIPKPVRGEQEQTPTSLDRWDRIQQTITSATQLPQTPGDCLTFFLPAWRWLKQYNVRTTLRKDIVAGLSVGVMVVPQAMSYARLAGLPVEYGLYSALVPVYLYGLFGSSRQLAIGPVSMVSLLLNTGLTPIMARRGYTDDSTQDYMAEYIKLALQTSFLVGIINIGLGLARLGFITIFLSRAVISGFTTGAAVLIGCSQLFGIFGFDAERGSVRIYQILYDFFANIGKTNYRTVIMGFGSLLLLLVLKHIGKTKKGYRWVQALGPLTVTVIGIALVAGLDLEHRGIPVVGHIPQGLPSVSAGVLTPIEGFGEIAIPVISITLFGFMESMAIAKRLAATHKYEIDSSLELIGLGVANLAGSMFQAFPVTGSFSRSIVNNECGAQSGIAGMVTATVVMFVLLFLTTIFELMPQCTLSAIIMSGVFGLLDYPEARKLWRVHRKDFTCWLCACVGTLFLGVEFGLLLSIGVSVLIVLYESAYPHTAVLGRLPGTTVYRNVKQYPEAEEYVGIVIIRVDAPLYFANAQNVREKIRKYRLAAEEDSAYQHGDVKYLILDLTPVSHIDTTALHVLEDMVDNYKSRNQQLCFCNPSLVVMKRFDEIGFTEKVGRRFFFSCAHDAVKWCLSEMDQDATSAHETQLQTSDGSHESRTNCNDDLGCPVRITRLAPLEVVFDA